MLAVEPHPRNFDLLERNAVPYNGRIKPTAKAVSLEPGLIGLSNPEIADKGHHAVYEFRQAAEDNQLAVEAITPEELTAIAEGEMDPKDRIGLFKINIEGSEKSLLASRRLDSLLSRTNIAIIEAHDRKLAGTSPVVLAAAARNGLVPFDQRGSFYLFESELAQAR